MALHLVNLWSKLRMVSSSASTSVSAPTSTSTGSPTHTTVVESNQIHQNISAVMAKMSQAVLAALKSLARSTIAVRHLLFSWLISLIKAETALSSTTSPSQRSTISLSPSPRRTLGDFGKEVEILLSHGSEQHVLRQLSEGLQKQFREALRDNMTCMLPSYNHQLPNGHERGTFLALDVGGSTFRVALVELLGEAGTNILAQKAYKITDSVKRLEGVEFFDWMAERIEDTIEGEPLHREKTELKMGLAWSFPVEQTSLRSGYIQDMGKGFFAAQALRGHDLADVLQAACERRNLHLNLSALLNDSTSTLLSKAYTAPHTRFSLILGTGVNIAIHLPTNTISPHKYGSRPSSWHTAANHVLVNTELGMFGTSILPFTRWDRILDSQHQRPGFQPLEHFVSGRYLGEMVRLVLVEAVDTSTLFGGELPESLGMQYSLDTEVISRMQGTSTIDEARSVFASYHPTQHRLSDEEVSFICSVASHVSRRASAIIAASLHALWMLRNESNASGTTTPVEERNVDVKGDIAVDVAMEVETTIGCTGSVVQSYPGFKDSCQQFLDELVEVSGGKRERLCLEEAVESSLIGAAVAVACL